MKLTKKIPCKYLTNWLIILLLTLSTSVSAQLITMAELDTLPAYSLEQALNQDPLTVFKLDLRKLKLTEVPEEIYQFKNLQVLILSKNKISEFPVKICQFKWMQKLDLSANRIETIPKEIAEMTEMRELIINQNKIQTLPGEIGKLKNMYFLDIWGTNIGSLPVEMSELKDNLKEMDMRAILMSSKEHKLIKDELPHTKIHFSKSCNCGFLNISLRTIRCYYSY